MPPTTQWPLCLTMVICTGRSIKNLLPRSHIQQPGHSKCRPVKHFSQAFPNAGRPSCQGTNQDLGPLNQLKKNTRKPAGRAGRVDGRTTRHRPTTSETRQQDRERCLDLAWALTCFTKRTIHSGSIFDQTTPYLRYGNCCAPCYKHVLYISSFDTVWTVQSRGMLCFLPEVFQSITRGTRRRINQPPYPVTEQTTGIFHSSRDHLHIMSH